MFGSSVMCDVGQEESGYKSEESPGVLSVKHINNRWRTPCPLVNYHIYTKHMTHNTLHQHHHPHTLHYWTLLDREYNYSTEVDGKYLM